MPNIFFKNHGPIKVSDIIKNLNLNIILDKDREIYDIKDLETSTNENITFFHSKNINILLKIQKHLFV